MFWLFQEVPQDPEPVDGPDICRTATSASQSTAQHLTNNNTRETRHLTTNAPIQCLNGTRPSTCTCSLSAHSKASMALLQLVLWCLGGKCGEAYVCLWRFVAGAGCLTNVGSRYCVVHSVDPSVFWNHLCRILCGCPQPACSCEAQAVTGNDQGACLELPHSGTPFHTGDGEFPLPQLFCQDACSPPPPPLQACDIGLMSHAAPCSREPSHSLQYPFLSVCESLWLTGCESNPIQPHRTQRNPNKCNTMKCSPHPTQHHLIRPKPNRPIQTQLRASASADTAHGAT